MNKNVKDVVGTSDYLANLHNVARGNIDDKEGGENEVKKFTNLAKKKERDAKLRGKKNFCWVSGLKRVDRMIERLQEKNGVNDKVQGYLRKMQDLLQLREKVIKKIN